jgi:hypothetical protein
MSNPNVYKYQVTYSKKFTNGLLKGITIDSEYVRFATWHAADDFAKTCDGETEVKPCIGSGAYIKSVPILEAI